MWNTPKSRSICLVWRRAVLVPARKPDIAFSHPHNTQNGARLIVVGLDWPYNGLVAEFVELHEDAFKAVICALLSTPPMPLLKKHARKKKRG
jgi:hypothetical protein